MNGRTGGPSPGWEPLTLPELPGAVVWSWRQSPGSSIVFQLDPRTHAAYPGRISLRRLLAAVGIDARAAGHWMAYGTVFDAAQGMNPLLDQPLVPPPPGMDPSIVVHLAPQPIMTPPPVYPHARTAAPTSPPEWAAGVAQPAGFASWL